MITGKFTYLGSDDVTLRTYDYAYDDNWLMADPTKENYDLLKFAYDLSLAASLRKDITDFYNQIGFDYTDAIDYEKEGLNLLAGAEVKDSVYYPAPQVDGKFYLNSIGYAIGYKRYGGNTLMIVSIRGGHYGSEWGGNFNIGTGQQVAGFEIAADQVLDGIKRTLEEIGIEGEVRILTSGYSRAASVSNLVAARLNQGEVPGIKKEGVFGFAFECPRGTRDPNAFSSDYDNLISVSNPNDAIPRLAESVFGYRRYGRTFFYPGVENDKNFYAKFAKMKEVEKTVIPFSLMPVIDAAYLENMFVNDFAFVIKDLDYYVNNYQNTLMNAAAKFLGGAKIEVTDQEFQTLGILQQGIYDADPLNTTRFAHLLGSEPKMIFKLNFLSPVFQNHAMELNLSWIESLEGFKDFSSRYYKLVYLDPVKDLSVCVDGEELASVVDGKVNNEKHRLFIDYDYNGQLVVLVNPQEEFVLTGNSQGPLNLSCARFDMQLGLKDKVENYVTQEKGKFEITLEAGEEFRVDVSADGQALSPEQVLEGADLKVLRVQATPEIPNVITGGGFFTEGEIVELKVSPEAKDKFKGWQVDGKIVSTDLTYRFKVKESTTVEAIME